MSNIKTNFTSLNLLKFDFFKRVLWYLLTSQISAEQELTILHLIQSYFMHPPLLLASLLYGKALWSLQAKEIFQTPMTSRLSSFLNWRYSSFLRALHILFLIQFPYSLIPSACEEERMRSWEHFLWGDRFWKLQFSQRRISTQRFTLG